MEQKKVKTEGSIQDMVKYTALDKQTIEQAINVVEQAANIDVEVPEEK
ncbi:hypothetical protein [Ammoniphilus sp. CFH 90114]|nr:hypothetical protein [Ammoniphilus sp. CFH 90114]